MVQAEWLGAVVEITSIHKSLLPSIQVEGLLSILVGSRLRASRFLFEGIPSNMSWLKLRAGMGSHS